MKIRIVAFMALLFLKSLAYSACPLFNGTNNYMISTTTPTINVGTQDTTWMCWINMTSTPTAAIESAMAGADGTGTGRGFLFVNTTSKASSAIGGSNLVGTSIFLPNTPYHLAVTHVISSNLSTLYVNGVSEGTLTITAESNQGNYVLGANKSLANGFFKGTIEDARAFTYAMSAAEIRSIYLSATHVQYASNVERIHLWLDDATPIAKITANTVFTDISQSRGSFQWKGTVMTPTQCRENYPVE